MASASAASRCRGASGTLGECSVRPEPRSGPSRPYVAEATASPPRSPRGCPRREANRARRALPFASRSLTEPFLGRESVMRRLAGALSDAQAGSGGLWLLVGDAGIGKTRCAGELATAARRANVAVCVGRCTSTEGAPAFWPWIQNPARSLRGSEGSAPRREAVSATSSTASCRAALLGGAASGSRSRWTRPASGCPRRSPAR